MTGPPTSNYTSSKSTFTRIDEPEHEKRQIEIQYSSQQKKRHFIDPLTDQELPNTGYQLPSDVQVEGLTPLYPVPSLLVHVIPTH